MPTFRMKALAVTLVIGGAFALMFVTAHPSATAKSLKIGYSKVAAFFPPALPSAWEKNTVTIFGHPAVVYVSDAVPLKAYDGLSPFMAIVGHVFSPS